MKAIDHTLAGLQHVLPGAERIGQGALARRLAAAPLAPRHPQVPCDVGLFSDSAQQLDLIEAIADKSGAEPCKARPHVATAKGKRTP